jgi:hypothetical protein
MAAGRQSITYAAQATAHPLLTRHWFARGFRLDDLLDRGENGQVFFRRRPRTTRQAYPVNRTVHQRSRQLHSPSTNGLLVDAGDFEQDAVRAKSKPLKFHWPITTRLLLVQPTQ